MKHKEDLAKGWLLKGDSDLANAKLTVSGAGPYDTACFHAQQAAEKYLKALLAFHGSEIPRTHDLEELQLLCIEFIPHVGFRNLALEELSDYAVSVRYDFEFWPDVKTSEEAVEMAEKVRLFVLAGMGA
ncbi:MAG: HEPN domain-containing protein [Mariprofundaceae bacterium]|nr:HEPN domain-containing protein [Mariprofundaceae bacterium]